MNLRSRNFLVVVSLVLLLCVGGVGIAVASPDGDDDLSYNPSLGTQYSLVDLGGEATWSAYGNPVADQAPNGDGINATLARASCGECFPPYGIEITRYDLNGKPVPGFGGKVTQDEIDEALEVPFGEAPTELLDLRVLGDGSFVVLARASTAGIYASPSRAGDRLWILRFDSQGQITSGVIRQAPGDCSANADNPFSIYVAAARVESGPDAGTVALWNCPTDLTDPTVQPGSTVRSSKIAQPRATDVWVSRYAANGQADGSKLLNAGSPGDYGADLEISPLDGHPYVLLGDDPDLSPVKTGGVTTRSGAEGTSIVYRLSLAGGGSTFEQTPADGSIEVQGLPADLAIDHKGRPLVWTQEVDRSNFFCSPDGGDLPVRRGGRVAREDEEWTISRLTPDLGSLDSEWGNGSGVARVADPALGYVYGGRSETHCVGKDTFLTVRPDNRVLATGPGFQFDNSGTPEVIVGLTDAGARDTGFATGGVKPFDYENDDPDRTKELQRVGEPTLQSDAKALVPSRGEVETQVPSLVRQRIAAPPSGRGNHLGLTRLLPPVVPNPNNPNNPATPDYPLYTGPGATGGTRPTRPSRPIKPSSTRVRCGRRVISLVRADVLGAKIRLTGLVGSKLYGKKVTIETDPTAVKASAYSRTATVRASKKTGAFSAVVVAPPKSQFKTVRYRAKSGGAKSPVLKLPQSLTSRSVKSGKGTITVKGQVKRSVLGKRNKLKIRRLVCGRYRTVAVVRPAADGSYTATFKASKIRGVSFYRAEIVVQVRPGSKKYAIQYARAIAIRTTSQTG